MNDNVDNIARAIIQDACADGRHIYTNDWHDELSRCTCGAVHPEHLAAATERTR